MLSNQGLKFLVGKQKHSWAFSPGRYLILEDSAFASDTNELGAFVAPSPRHSLIHSLHVLQVEVISKTVSPSLASLELLPSKGYLL